MRLPIAHDVFISYSTIDTQIAEAVRDRLEESGVPCWMAPRDILPGREWPGALVEAIDETKLVVLVFSSDSNDSPYVLTEIAQAFQQRTPILPFRVEQLEPTGDMGFYLRVKQWLDAIPPPYEPHLTTLCDAVLVLLGKAEAAPKQPEVETLTKGGLAELVPEAAPTDEPTKTLLTYFGRVRQELESRFAADLVRPDRMYVPQYASPLENESVEIGLEAFSTSFWEGDPARVAVLGNYGTGKTYFAWRAVLDQIAGCESDLDATIPILFPLRSFSYADTATSDDGGRDLIDQVLAYARSIDFPRVDRRQFVRWLEDGRVGVILDGLDELVLPPDVKWTRVAAPLLAVEGARVLVTGRTAYLKDPVRELEGFAGYELRSWEAREWHAYVDRLDTTGALREAGGKESFLAAVADRPSLTSLTSRPLWCYMIASIAPEIVELDDLALAGLYQRFLDRAVGRRPMATSRLSLVWQFCSMERFAEECAHMGVSSLPEESFQSLLDGLFESVGYEKLREYLIQDVRTYAFLNCDRRRVYSFGHKSFEEYFAAAACARRLAEQATGESSGPPELVPRTALLEQRRLSEEEMGFLVGIVRDESASRSLELVPESAQLNLHSRILRHLERLLASDDVSPVERANDFRVYVPLLRDVEPRPRIAGIDLQQTNLAAVDLHDCDFRKVDFSEAVLFGANLAGSSFDGCVFFGASLDGADFTEADLAGADLVGVELEREGGSPVFASARGLDQARLTSRERRLLSLDAPA